MPVTELHARIDLYTGKSQRSGNTTTYVNRRRKIKAPPTKA